MRRRFRCKGKSGGRNPAAKFLRNYAKHPERAFVRNHSVISFLITSSVLLKVSLRKFPFAKLLLFVKLVTNLSIQRASVFLPNLKSTTSAPPIQTTLSFFTFDHSNE